MIDKSIGREQDVASQCGEPEHGHPTHTESREHRCGGKKPKPVRPVHGSLHLTYRALHQGSGNVVTSEG